MSVKQVASGDSHGCSIYFSTCPTLLISFSLLLSFTLQLILSFKTNIIKLTKSFQRDTKQYNKLVIISDLSDLFVSLIKTRGIDYSLNKFLRLSY